jgi:alcohol dehydrogenase class IV
MKFEFATTTRIVFGAGAVKHVTTQMLMKRHGRRAFVVTGRNARHGEALAAVLRGQGMDVVNFSVSGEPEIDTVRAGVALAKQERRNFVIGIGGGSAIDAGKAIAAMLTNRGDLLDYIEIIGRGKALTKWSAPFTAIPTTAGTGSEVTRNAVLASPEHKLKVSLRSPLMAAQVAVVDPELTYDLPPAITASTGLDALTQLIEPFVCNRANPMTDGLCVEGLRRAARSLRVAFSKGQDKDAREDMAVASLFGGLALSNAGLGAVHGFAGPIGGGFPAPHGAICAALLPHVMAMNLRALRQRDSHGAALFRYEEAAWWLTGDSKAKADDGVEWVRALALDLKVPRLGSFGIQPTHIADLVVKAAKASCMKANPIVLTPEELAETLRLAL